MKSIIKNFRFWILIIGIAFWVAGLVIQKLGIPPEVRLCPLSILPIDCEESDPLYTFGEMVEIIGVIFSFVGMSLLIAQFFTRVIKSSQNRGSM